MAFNAGSAWIRVSPNLSGFQLKITAEVKKLRAVSVKVTPNFTGFDTEYEKQRTKPRKPVAVKAELDQGAFARDVRGKLEAALASLPKDIGLNVDATDAEREIASLRTQLETLSKQRIGVDISDEAALAEIEYVRTELERLGHMSPSVQVKVDTAAATAKLEGVRVLADSIKPTIEVDADTSKAQRKISALGGRTRLLLGAGLAAAPLAGPLLAAGAGAGAGLAGIGAGVGAGVGGFAAIAGAQIKRAKDLEKQLQAANKQLNAAANALASASTPAGKATARANYATALDARNGVKASISPAQGRLLTGMDTLSSSWNKFLASGGGMSVIGPLVKGMQALEKSLPAVGRFLKPVSGALGDIFGQFGNAAGSKGFRSFASDLGHFSGVVMRQAAAGTTNLAHGFGNLLRQFMPLSTSMGTGLVDLTRKFARWSDGLSHNKGFQSFLAYVRKEGPIVMQTIGSILTVVGKLIIALAPLGGVMLKGLQKVFGFLAKLSPGQLLAIAAGVTTLFAAFKIARLVKDIRAAEGAFAALNVVMDANPIGIVVVALGLLAAGLIYAYKHSATFRKIVNGAMTAVKAIALGVVTWFHDKFVPFFTKTIPGAFRATLSWVKSHWPLILAIITGPIGLATLFIVRHWSTITGAFRSALGWVTSTFRRAWNVVDNIVMAPIKAARDGIQNIFGAGGPIRTAFSKAVTAIGNILDGLRAAARKPVAFIVNTVYNNGIRKVVNAIPIPGVPNLPTIKGWSTGGYTGRGGKYEPAGIVHKDEFVLDRETTNRARPVIEALHRTKGRMFGYAHGGAVQGLFRPVRHGHPGPIHDQYTGFPAVDVSIPVGSTVAAGAAGRVTKSYDIRGYEPRRVGPQDGYRSYGRVIQILSNGFSTLYAHLSRRGVHVGQHVAGGQVIGLSGNTGNTTGPHLHFGAQGISPLAFFGGSTNYTGSLGPGGSSAGAGYAGPSLGSVLSHLNPASWMKSLRGMGGWGPMLAGTVGNLASAVKHFATEKIRAAIKAAGRVVGKVGNAIFGSTTRHGSLSPSAARDTARGMMPIGWSFGDLDKLWTRESGWRWNADNPTSSAYGIPQALPGSKMASAGADWRTNAVTQMVWGLNYIKGRYGSPQNAWAHELSHGWYDKGGYLPPGLSQVYNGTGKPEPVFTSAQWDTLRSTANRPAPAGPSITYENVTTFNVDELMRKQRAESQKVLAMSRLPL